MCPIPFRSCLPAVQRRLDAGDVAPHLAHARGVLELSARPLETQVERFLAEVDQHRVQLVVRLLPNVRSLHRPVL
jgi:hypothetical protein